MEAVVSRNEIAELPREQSTRAILAGIIGNALEWYEFGVYAYFSTVISNLFFPTKTPFVALLLTFAVFGVGFAMRPAGAIVFGIYGDRVGRRNALAAVIGLMAISTFGIGLLPTYDQVGVLAPLLLVVARLLQGLSVGGGACGSVAYLVEHAPDDRRGFVGSWQQFSTGAGFLIGSATAAVLTRLMSADEILAGGWRIPFLAGILLGLVAAYMRWRIQDTPKFTVAQEQGAVTTAPLKEAFTTYRRSTLDAFGITLLNAVGYYIVIGYMPTYLTTVLKLPRESALMATTAGLVVFVALIPLTGMLSDRVGRKPVLLASCIGYAVLAYPLYALAATGQLALVVLAQCGLTACHAFFGGASPALYAELFPTSVRYTALSVGYNLAVAIFGGFAPLIATYLVGVTGDPLAPTYYLILAAIVTGLVTTRIPETAFRPLQ